MLWLALHLPQLPLEARNRGDTAPGLCALVDQGRITHANSSALQAGVRPGLGLAAARSLAPDLQLLERRPAREAHALRQLADWALQFTSQVSRQPPDSLLLELGGSLRLFGGLDALMGKLTEELALLGYRHQHGIAPTPVAAWLLARHGVSEPVMEPAQLPQRLAALPCSLLPLDTARQRALAGLGAQTVGDLMALPSKDLGNRLGNTLMHLLEQALGRRADPRPPHQPERRYSGRLELPAPAHSSEAILFALQRLLRELAGLLQGLEAGVQQLELRLEHHRHPPTRLHPGLMRPSRCPEHLLMVCRERLERQVLPAAVTTIELHAHHLLPLAPEALALLEAEAQENRHRWLELTERLRARLGEHTVHGLGTRPEHRPEHAWRQLPLDQSPQQLANPHRPLWLLSPPQPLPLHQGQPCWHGPLVLCHGPERIETGWWDGHDISRDYYRARAKDGALLWIYRDRRPPRGWYLHGFFG